MTKLVIIHPRIEDSLLQSFASDVIPVQYNAQLTKEQLLSYGPVSHVAFLYHYPGFERLPFFPDSILSANASDRPLKPTYKYFSNNVIDIIKSLRDANSNGQQFVVDILSCDLNSQRYKDEVALIETDLNVDIRYSLDKTGNPSSGANWVLESDNVNIRDVYFTQNILSWNGVLTGDISSAIKAGTYNAFITWNISTKTYTQQKSFDSTDLGFSAGLYIQLSVDSYIQLLAGETYNGNGYTINFDGLSQLQGLFETRGTSIDDAPIVKNLGVLNGSVGSLYYFGGYIIRENQSFFKVVNCYSTGSIGNASGGIVGAFSGIYGSCEINNCYSTGSIGIDAGGIAGIMSGVSGNCKIFRCYSRGPIGINAGGIVGSYAAYDFGNCEITNCYSTGLIGIDAGGITGYNAGLDSGTCIINNCYSTGLISDNSGGIIGPDSINYTVTNCVSNSPTVSGASEIPTNSTVLSTLNTIPNGWSNTIWASGLAVTVGSSSYTLPILKAFQASPWLSTSTDSLYYNQATDNAVLFLSSNYTMSTPTPTPVTVNLNVNVNADGKIEVFGHTEPLPGNVIVSKTKMPVTALYSGDSEGGLIEFWEPINELGNIKVALAHSDSSSYGGFNFSPSGVPYYKTCAKRLALGIESVLCNKFDCATAAPFTGYAGNTNYTQQRDFGRLALSNYAHTLFGHIAATAAITNDKSFMKNILNVSEDSVDSSAANEDAVTGPYNRYVSYDKRTMINNSDVLNWTTTYHKDNANIAVRIVDEVIKKGINSDGTYKVSDVNSVVNAAPGAPEKSFLAAIVAQVIGQDATRAMGQDNNALVPEVRHLLKFMDGDKIYLQINLQKPVVSVYGGDSTLQKAYNEINSVTTTTSFTLEITLGAPDASIILADTASGTSISTILSGVTVNNSGVVSVTPAVTDLIKNATTLEAQSLIRNALVNSIFSTNQASYTITDPSKLGLSMSGITSVTLYNYSQLPTENGVKYIDFANIGSNAGIYIGFNSIGSSILLKNSSSIFSGILTQVSATKYMFGGQYYNVGDSFTFANKSIVLGSVSAGPVFPPVDPVSVSYNNQEITLTYSSSDAVTNVLAMAYRVDGNPWVNGQIADINFTKSGNTIVIPNITSSPLTMVFDVRFAGAEAPKRYTHTFVSVTAATYDSITYDAANQRLVLQFNSVNGMSAASIVTAMYYSINNGAWSSEQLLGSGFTVSGEYLYINGVTFAPNKFEADIFYSTQPNPIHNSTELKPFIETPVNPSSAVYDEFNQQLVFTYPSVTQNDVAFDAVYVAGSVSRIDFILDEKYDTTGWLPPFKMVTRGDRTFVQNGGDIIIPNVLRTPNAVDIATILQNGAVIQAGPTRGPFSVPTVNNDISTLTVADPINSFLYNSFEQTITMEFPTNAHASAIIVMDCDIWNGSTWSGFTRHFARSADGPRVFTRIGAKIVLSGITVTPVAMRTRSIYLNNLGVSDVNYGVARFYYSPVGPVSIMYNPNISKLRLEYANAGIASSVNTINYDITYNNGGGWTGFNTLMRSSGGPYPPFTRVDKYIYISGIPLLDGDNPTHMRVIGFFDKPGSDPSDINTQIDIDTTFTV